MSVDLRYRTHRLMGTVRSELAELVVLGSDADPEQFATARCTQTAYRVRDKHGDEGTT